MSDYTTHVYDENAVLRQRIAELEAQVEKGRNIVRNDIHRAGQYQARIDALEAALRKIIDMNVQYAVDKYGDASKAETMSCVSTARAALKD